MRCNHLPCFLVARAACMHESQQAWVLAMRTTFLRSGCDGCTVWLQTSKKQLLQQAPDPVPFTITPESLENVQAV